MKTVDFSEHLFRCSQLSKLMVGVKPNLTENQAKELKRLSAKQSEGTITTKQTTTLGDLIKKRDAKPSLSKTTENHLSDVHKGVFFGRDRDINNKYLDKGIQAEEKSITLYSDLTGRYFEKNKNHFSNDFIKGTPDEVSDKVRDIKSSWSFHTFPLHDTEIPTDDYWWQLQGYMSLTGVHEAELIYCLNDTPFKLIEDELRRLDWRHNVLEFSGEVRKERIDVVVECVSNLIYTREGLEKFIHQSPILQYEWFDNFHPIPDEYRMKKFSLKYEPEAIERLNEQIELCREHLNKITINMAEKVG